jgi:hypothetical protein
MKMKNKILVIMLLLLAMFLAAFAVHAESGKQVSGSVENKEKPAPAAVSTIEVEQTTPSKSVPLANPALGYKLVTDVLDGFGGESESDNYKIPVNSGGQASVVGISVGVTFGTNAGYAYASHVKHGDANANGLINLSDVIYLLNYLFRGGSSPCPMEAGDVNCDGAVNLSDDIILLNYLFRGGEAPSC